MNARKAFGYHCHNTYISRHHRRMLATKIVVAGKGHEDYQEVAGARRAFSDVEASRLALRERAAGVAA